MKNYAIVPLLVALFLVVSCNKTDNTKKEMPVMPYKVIEIKKSNTELYSEYPVSLEGIVDIEIRAKVDGYIEKIYVDEGQEVKKGQPLFKLETQTATQDAAAAKARVDAAIVEVNRLKPLVERNIISDVQLETAKANLASARSSYQAILERINYATIKSPVNGIVGSLPMRIGSYVSSATPEPLTRISDISSIYAYFSVNEKEQLDIMLNAEGKTFQEKINKIMPVQLLMSNGVAYEQLGKVETFSGQADKMTGTFNVRAKFANPNKLLRSGGSGTIKIPTQLNDVIVVPQSATIEMQDKRLALIVDAENKVKSVPVEVKAVSGGKYFVITKGLEVGNKLLVEGVGILTDGTAIKPEVVESLEALQTTTK
jgi:membrane fusion protein (multidrug efflux system)